MRIDSASGSWAPLPALPDTSHPYRIVATAGGVLVASLEADAWYLPTGATAWVSGRSPRIPVDGYGRALWRYELVAVGTDGGSIVGVLRPGSGRTQVAIYQPPAARPPASPSRPSRRTP